MGVDEAGHATDPPAVGGRSIGSQFYLQGLVLVKIFHWNRDCARHGVLSNKDESLVLVREVVDDMTSECEALLSQVLE